MLAFWFQASALQVNGVAVVLFDWSSYLDSFFQAQEDISSLGIAYFEVGCLAPSMSSYLVESIFFATSPILVLIVVGVVLLAGQYCTHERPSCKLAFANVTSELKGVAVVILYLAQPMLTQRAAQLLACVEIDEQVRMLANDLSIACWDSQHIMILATVFVPMVLLYIIGIPVGLLVILRHNRVSRKDFRPGVRPTIL